MKSRAFTAFLVSALLTAAIWAFSTSLTGKDEPWDSEGLYYLVALAIGGAIAGAAVPAHFGAHYAGAFSGQVAYELVFLKLGPLFVLGLAFLAAYCTVFVLAAALAASLRKRLSRAGNAA